MKVKTRDANILQHNNKRIVKTEKITLLFDEQLLQVTLEDGTVLDLFPDEIAVAEKAAK